MIAEETMLEPFGKKDKPRGRLRPVQLALSNAKISLPDQQESKTVSPSTKMDK